MRRWVDPRYEEFIALTIAERREFANKITNGSTESIPLFLIRGSAGAPLIKRALYGVPASLSFGRLMNVLREKVLHGLRPEEAIFFMLPPQGITNSHETIMVTANRGVGEIYDRYHSHDDGILYIYISAEDCFG